MVHVATRSDEVPARLGPDVPQLPGWGTTVVDREVYADPVRFELEREHVLRRSWILAGRSVEIPEPGDWLSFEGHGETVVITRQPRRLARRVPQRVPAPRARRSSRPTRAAAPAGSPARTTAGCTTPRASSWASPSGRTSTPRSSRACAAPLAKADEWGGWIWLNLDGDDEDAPSLDRLDRRRHHPRPRPVRDGEHDPRRQARRGTCR